MRVNAVCCAVRALLGYGDPWWGGVRRLRRASIQVMSVSGMRALLGVHVHMCG